MRRRAELPHGRTIDECLEDFSPRSQALKDARTRDILRALDLEKDLAAARCLSHRPPRNPDLRKVFIADFAARHPGVTGRALAIALDSSEFRPLPSWIRATGKRLWQELWDYEKNPKTQRSIRKYVYGAAGLSPAVTGDNLPHPPEGV